jgi:hypothetical protein
MRPCNRAVRARRALRRGMVQTKGAMAMAVAKANPGPMDMFQALRSARFPSLFRAAAQGRIQIRRALAAEKYKVAAWVKENFTEGWASEAELAFGRQPVSCFIAVQDGRKVAAGALRRALAVGDDPHD